MSFKFRIFKQKKIGVEGEKKGWKEIDRSTFSAARRVVQDKYHRRDPKLMNHNSKRKRRWKSKDFSVCQEEGDD